MLPPVTAPAPAKPHLHLPLFFCGSRCRTASHLPKPRLQQRHQRRHRLATRCTPPPLEDRRNGEHGEEESLLPSARAVAEAIRRASPASPVQFVQRTEKDVKIGSARSSPDFLRLCAEQIDLFRMVVHRDAVLSVYVRPAGSYVMDQLELRRVYFCPEIDGAEVADCVILIGNFGIPVGLRAAEAYLSDQQVSFLTECGTIVLPMVKHPFVVGFVVAELPFMEMETCGDAEDDEQQSSFGSSSLDAYGLARSDRRIWEIQSFKKELAKTYQQFTAEQSARAIMISRSLALAYVMDQKALLLQQSTWQNNVRMSHLVEQ